VTLRFIVDGLTRTSTFMLRSSWYERPDLCRSCPSTTTGRRVHN